MDDTTKILMLRSEEERLLREKDRLLLEIIEKRSDVLFTVSGWFFVIILFAIFLLVGQVFQIKELRKAINPNISIENAGVLTSGTNTLADHSSQSALRASDLSLAFSASSAATLISSSYDSDALFCMCASNSFGDIVGTIELGCGYRLRGLISSAGPISFFNFKNPMNFIVRSSLPFPVFANT